MEATNQQKPANKRKGIIITIVILTILILVGGGGIYFLKYQNENAIWTSVENDGTISGYERFIEQYPENSHVAEAKKMVEKMKKEDQSLWNKVLRNPNRAALNEYIGNMSKIGGQHIEEAIGMLEVLEWNEIVNSTDIQLIKDYMSKNPGKHLDEIDVLLNKSIKSKAQKYIMKFMTKYSNENIEGVMSFFDDITPVYQNKNNVSRYELYDDMKAAFIEEGNKTYTPDFSQLEAHEDSRGQIITSFPATVTLPNIPIEEIYEPVFDSTTVTSPSVRFHINFDTQGKITLLQIEE